MSRKILIFLVAAMVSVAVGADEVQLRTDHPQTYTVQKGDTLWDISGRFLTKPWQWPEIWHANPQIQNPNLIYPGDVLALEYVNGKPGLKVVDRNVRLSPSIRESAHGDAVHAIPLDAVQPFLSRPRVVGQDEIEGSAYIVGSLDNHLTLGAGSHAYVRNLGQPTTNKYSIFRKGGPYIDPESHKILGYEAEHVGDALIERLGDPATVVILRANKEVLDGDRLLPQQFDEVPEFVPHAPPADFAGRIISSMGGFSQISQHQVVVLNRGSRDGLEPGHVLAIYQQGKIVKDVLGSDIAYQQREEADRRAAEEGPSKTGRLVQSLVNDVRSADRSLRDLFSTPVKGGSSVRVRMPEERAGELMVFRTFDGVAYGLVMNIQRPVYVMDAVRNP